MIKWYISSENRNVRYNKNAHNESRFDRQIGLRHGGVCCAFRISFLLPIVPSSNHLWISHVKPHSIQTHTLTHNRDTINYVVRWRVLTFEHVNTSCTGTYNVRMHACSVNIPKLPHSTMHYGSRCDVLSTCGWCLCVCFHSGQFVIDLVTCAKYALFGITELVIITGILKRPFFLE